jgi:putative peptide maturation dehydrogenase
LRTRRTVYFFVHCHDRPTLDVRALLQGVARADTRQQLHSISILRGDEVAISREELDAALEFPSAEWTNVDPDREAEVEALARKGLVVVDSVDEELTELRRRDERLNANEWNLYAAAYHFLTRWRDVDIRAGGPDEGSVSDDLTAQSAAMLEGFVQQFGPPPHPFHQVEQARGHRELPLVDRDGGLYDVLLRRKTTRGYDRTRSVAVEELSTILRYVFGCHGLATLVGNFECMKRTSPSGGALHAIEAYPLVSGVAGLDSGLYHYRASDHSLELLDALSADDVSSLATDFMCGQTYLGAAHVSVVLTARYYRSFWKYRRHQRVYAALLMDAAHLSQTLYLVATELELGAYVTAAINSSAIDERLGLDPVSEGALAVVGFGQPSEAPAPLQPTFTPYRPRDTNSRV